MRYTLNVNGESRSVDVDAKTPLLWVLRDELELKGTKFGCGMSLCGACTVHVDGAPTRACVTPVSAVGAARITTITLTLVFDPTRLRVRSVQEGSFMRAGGAAVSFNQQVSGNRIDITLVRSADATGASGTGLLAAVLFDAIAPGSATLSLSGTATGPAGTPMGLRFTPVTVTVQQ